MAEPFSIIKIITSGFTLINGSVDFVKLCNEIGAAPEEIEVAVQKVNLIRNSLEDVVRLLNHRDLESDPDGSTYVNGVVRSADEAVRKAEERLRKTKRLRWHFKDKKIFDGFCQLLNTARDELSEPRLRLNSMKLLPLPPPYEELKFDDLEIAGQSYRPFISQGSAAKRGGEPSNGYKPYSFQKYENTMCRDIMPS